MVLFPDEMRPGSATPGRLSVGRFQLAAQFRMALTPVAFNYCDDAPPDNSRCVEEGETLSALFMRHFRTRTRIRLTFGPRLVGSHAPMLKHQTESFLTRRAAWRSRQGTLLP